MFRRFIQPAAELRVAVAPKRSLEKAASQVHQSRQAARASRQAQQEFHAKPRRVEVSQPQIPRIEIPSFEAIRIPGWNILTPVADTPAPHAPERKKKTRSTQTSSVFRHPFFTQKRFYSQITGAWSNVKSPFRVTEYLSDKDIVLPHGLDFTITNPQYITRRLNELRELYSAIGTRDRHQQPFRVPKDLVVFTPERMGLHFTAATVATEIKTEDELEYVHICRTLNKSIQQMIADRRKHFLDLAFESEARAHDIIKQHERSEYSEDLVVQNYLNIRRAVSQRFAPLNYSPKIIDSIISKILIDDFVRESRGAEIHSLVTDTITQELHLQHFTALDLHRDDDRQQILLLPQFPADQRLTQVMAGGIATGKSSVAKRFAAELKEKYGLKLSDFAKISTDIFRLLLLDDPSIGDNHELKSLLTQDEARFITELSIKLVDQKLDQEGYAPLVFMEAVSPSDAELVTGTKSGGKVRVAMTSYPPDKAVEGNYARSQDRQERSPPVTAVLGSQQLSSKETPKILDKHRGKDIVMTLHDTYKLIHESAEGNALIAIFHCQQEKVIILDVHGMLDFVKKMHINPSATCPHTVYPHPEKVTLSANMENFLSHYGNKEIVFVNPAEKIGDINDYDKHAYAVYSPQSGLVIKNESVYKKILTGDTDIKEAFSVLEAISTASAQINHEASESIPTFSPKI